jgi:uncharacterized membrane protein
MMLLPSLPTGQAQSTGDPWWGASDKAHPTQGYAIRVPVLVENALAYPLANPLVSVDVDFGKLLLDAGWSSTIRIGTAPTLTGFTLDEGSIRVVDYGRNGWSGGPVNGASTPPTPAQFYPGAWHADHAAPYGNQTNPAGTLLIAYKGTLAPHEKHYFYVYANPREFEDAPATPHPFSLVDRAPLDAFLWGGSLGTTFYGFEPQQGGTQHKIDVLPMTPGASPTVVTLYTLQNGKFTLATTSGTNPAYGFVGSHVTFLVPANTAWKVVTDRPSLVAAQRAGDAGAQTREIDGFVPGLDGSFAGSRFALFGVKSDQFGAAGGSYQMVRAGGGSFTVTCTTLAPPPSGGSGCLGQAATLSPANTLATIGVAAGAWVELDASTPEARFLVSQHVLSTSANEGLAGYAVPALTGGPEGTEFFAAAPNDGGLYRLCADAPLELRAVSFAHPSIQAFPEGPVDTTPPLGLAAGCVDEAAQATTPDAPLDFYSTIDPRTGVDTSGVPFRLSVSATGRLTTSLERPAFGAVGGVAGLDFQTVGKPGQYGRIEVFGHYNGTDVNVTMDRLSRTGQVVTTSAIYHVGVDGVLNGAVAPLLDPARDATSLWRYHLVASKPISVVYADDMQTADGSQSYPYGRVVPAEPVSPRATVLGAEFRGPLVAITSPDAPGRNFLYESGGPGSALDFTLDVHNLGRWLGGEGLADTVSLSCDAPDDWKVSGCSRDLTMAGGEAQRVQLSITPSAGDVNLTKTVTVMARSRSGGSPALFAIRIHVEVRYGVGMWFDVEGGRKTIDPPIGVDPGATYHYDVIVKNTGSTTDTFELSVKPPAEGWTQALTLGGKPVTRVTLDAGASRALDFAVTAPNQETAPKSFVSITAQSDSAFNAGDVVNTATQIRPKISISLKIDPPAQVVAPGDNATFNLTVNNSGNSIFLIRLVNDSQLPAGWTSAFSLDPPEVNLNPGDSYSFGLGVTPPPGSRAGDLATLKLTALVGESDTNLQPGDQVGAVVVVRRVHDLTTPNLPDAIAAPNETLRYLLPIANAGNGDDALELLSGAVSPAWHLVSDAPSLDLPYNQTAELPLTLQVPPGAPAGLTNLTFTVRLSREATQNLSIPIQVLPTARLDVRAPADVRTSPGRPTQIEATVVNVGNLAGDFAFALDAPEGWNATVVPSHASLDVGATLPVRVLLNASRAAEDGRFPARLAASFGGAAAGGANLSVAIARPLLALSGVQTTGTLANGDLVLVSAGVQNTGAIDAENVTVALVVDGAAVSKVVLERVPVDQTKVATLNWVATGTPKEVRVVIDPQGDVVQASRDHTEQVVTFASRVPGPEPALFLALAISLALVLRRRRA